MNIGRRIDLAAELIGAAFRFAEPATETTAAFFRAHRELGPNDRRWLADTLYRALRQRLVLERLAEGGPGSLPRRLAMLAASAERAEIEPLLTPPERDWLDRACAVDRAALPEAVRLNLPGWIAAALRVQLGAELEALAGALEESAPLDLRVNAADGPRERMRAELATAGIESAATRWSPWGLRVVGKPAIERTAAFLRGGVEVQDEGSQMLSLVVGAKRGETVVDFCAGAGGKTLALAAAMRGSGRILAFDTSAHRLEALKPRLARNGVENVYAMCISGVADERLARWRGKVDRVLVDAPCSGLGTARRHPDLKWRHAEASIDAFQRVQREILAHAADLVKPGGRLVYATCSLLAREGESVADDFDARSGFDRLGVAELLVQAGLSEADARSLAPAGDLRLWPHRQGTDGFFAAAWRRH